MNSWLVRVAFGCLLCNSQTRCMGVPSLGRCHVAVKQRRTLRGAQADAGQEEAKLGGKHSPGCGNGGKKHNRNTWNTMVWLSTYGQENGSKSAMLTSGHPQSAKAGHALQPQLQGSFCPYSATYSHHQLWSAAQIVAKSSKPQAMHLRDTLSVPQAHPMPAKAMHAVQLAPPFHACRGRGAGPRQ